MALRGCGPTISCAFAHGLHLRAIRHLIAFDPEQASSDRQFIACTITKSYAPGGSGGALDVIDVGSDLGTVVAASNHRLGRWLADDEVYLPELQDIDPGPIDAGGVEAAFADGKSSFVGSWDVTDARATGNTPAPDPAGYGRISR